MIQVELDMRMVSLSEMTRAMRGLDLLPAPTEWVLVAPDGRLWTAEPAVLIQVLMPHHPLLKPMGMGELLGGG